MGGTRGPVAMCAAFPAPHEPPLAAGDGSLRKMIRYLLLQNRQGKTRLSKWYVPVTDSEKREIEYDVHRLVTKARGGALASLTQVDAARAPGRPADPARPPQRSKSASNVLEFGKHKVVYKQYAGLFFSCCIDLADNELVVLEAMHLFVELLDHYFEQVCELDLVFNFHKVYLIIDEFILGGEVQETSKVSRAGRGAGLLPAGGGRGAHASGHPST